MIHAIFYNDDRCAKPHNCVESLWPQLMGELKRRGLWPVGGTEIEAPPYADAQAWMAVQLRVRETGNGVAFGRQATAPLDLGGCIGQDTPMLTVTLEPCVAFAYPAEQAEAILLELRGLPPRVFVDGSRYRKFHGRWIAVVMAEEHWTALVEAVMTRLPEAQQAIAAYYKERPQTLEALTKMRQAGQPSVERV